MILFSEYKMSKLNFEDPQIVRGDIDDLFRVSIITEETMDELIFLFNQAITQNKFPEKANFKVTSIIIEHDQWKQPQDTFMGKVVAYNARRYLSLKKIDEGSYNIIVLENKRNPFVAYELLCGIGEK